MFHPQEIAELEESFSVRYRERPVAPRTKPAWSPRFERRRSNSAELRNGIGRRGTRRPQ